jgi:nucleoside-diphosphate-sugar epimerase
MKLMNAKNIIITGGTGFVGANLVERLVKDGHNVHLLVRPEYNEWRVRDLLPHLQIHIINLLDEEHLRTKVAAMRPDWVFHLATYGAYSRQDDLHTAIQTNFLGTVNLIEACRAAGFEVFINTGSSSEYGFKDHAPAEYEWIDPNSYYAVTKASATLFCRYTASRHNLTIPTLRLYSVYGPYEDRDRLIPKVILHGLQGTLPPLADPEIARDFVYARDVENAYLLLANQSHGTAGEVYNLGTGIQTSLRAVVALARQVFDLSVEPQWGTMQKRAWDTTIWKANNAALLDIGWQPEFTFEQGFRQTVAWFQNRPELLSYYLGTS